MARESGRLGLLQDTGATNTSRARESILREPVPRPAGTREGEAGSQASGPPAHPCEPGLPIVNIYLTSVTPARHRCLPPPPLPVTPPNAPLPRTWSRPRRRLPPERPRRPRVRVRVCAAAGLVRALWALWALWELWALWALCAARGAPAPRRTPGRPADKCSRLPRERARAGEADADAACDSGNPLRPTSHLSATAATTEERASERGSERAEGGRESGGRRGAELGARRAPRRRLRLAGVRHPGLVVPLLAVRRGRGCSAESRRPPGERAWARGRGHSGLARGATPRPGPLALRAATDRRKFYLQLGARGGWWDSPALCSVSASGGRAGSAGGRAGGGDRPRAGTVNYHSDDRQLRLD